MQGRFGPVELLGMAAEEGARFDAVVTSAPLRPTGDERLLRREPRNRLENARRYSDSEVEVFVEPPAGQAIARVCTYFSDRGRPFQSDRGRCFSVIVDGLGRHASPGVNVAQSSTISLKRPAVAPASGPVLGFD